LSPASAKIQHGALEHKALIAFLRLTNFQVID
jgi:hypothetical protein